MDRLDSLAQWKARHSAASWAARAAAERALIPPGGDEFEIAGYCWIDRSETVFHVDFLYCGEENGVRVPNWRERLVCDKCGLNCRHRASLHAFEQELKPRRKARIYVTEQLTPLYAWLSRHYPNTTGSEFLGDQVEPGRRNEAGVRHEDLTRLSFPNASVDYVLSFDVFEHVPDYRRAFAECARILAPGGAMLFTVPFAANSDPVIVRAVLEPSGEVKHLLPAEFHGDPVRPEAGVLCFQHFGWKMLDELRECGFLDAHALAFHSARFGYLGDETLLFIAEK